MAEFLIEEGETFSFFLGIREFLIDLIKAGSGNIIYQVGLFYSLQFYVINKVFLNWRFNIFT